MSLKKILVMAGAAVLLSGLSVTAGEKTSVELGKKLFNNPGLSGSNSDKSCNSCHPNGAKLEKVGANKQQTKAINRCLTGSLAGKKLDGRGVEIKSLKLYIATLAQK